MSILSISLALASWLTPVPPTVALVDTGMNDLGLWPFVTVALVLGLVVYLFRKFARR